MTCRTRRIKKHVRFQRPIVPNPVIAPISIPFFEYPQYSSDFLDRRPDCCKGCLNWGKGVCSCALPYMTNTGDPGSSTTRIIFSDGFSAVSTDIVY